MLIGRKSYRRLSRQKIEAGNTQSRIPQKSGSFLIKAFDVTKEWYDEYNQRILSKKNRNTLEPHFEIVQNIEMKILTENLFGVDLDPQAAEITAVNLMLKALRKGEKLPKILGVNVRIGNSLLSGSEPELGELSPEIITSLRPFCYDTEFPEIFAQGGFSVVIGNPPPTLKQTTVPTFPKIASLNFSSS